MKSGLTCNRKGQQISEIATVIIVMFALPFIFLTVAFTFEEINDDWQVNIDNNISRDIVATTEGQFVSITDNGFLIILVGLILAGVASLFVLNTHPFMFIVTAIGIIILLYVAAIMQNSFSDVTETGLLGDKLADYTFMPLIMNNMYVTVSVIAAIFTVAFFAKLRLSS